jgi:hypothetical protein
VNLYGGHLLKNICYKTTIRNRTIALFQRLFLFSVGLEEMFDPFLKACQSHPGEDTLVSSSSKTKSTTPDLVALLQSIECKLFSFIKDRRKRVLAVAGRPVSRMEQS